MAKMFYTLEEAAAKLGMTTDEVQALVESGQLQEFRDRDNLMFKVDQVDLLGGDDDDDFAEITLADTAMGGGLDASASDESGIEPISLSSSGSGSVLSLEGTGDSTGVSIFDAEDEDEAEANAETLVSGGGLGGMALNDSGAESGMGLGGSGFDMDAGASGSGLAQLAFEPDDTSLGGNLLDDLASDTAGGESALGASALGASVGGALFEGAEETPSSFSSQAGAMPMVMPMGEAYDGPASGLFGGVALGSLLVLMLAMAIMILGLSGGTTDLLGSVDQNMLYMIMGGSALVMIIFAVVGWVMLRKG